MNSDLKFPLVCEKYGSPVMYTIETSVETGFCTSGANAKTQSFTVSKDITTSNDRTCHEKNIIIRRNGYSGRIGCRLLFR